MKIGWVGIGRMGELKRLEHVVVPDRSTRRRVPKIGFGPIIDRFVDDIPAFHPAPEMFGDAVDMRSEVRQCRLAPERPPGVILKEPLRGLTVPTERVANDFQVVVRGKGDDLLASHQPIVANVERFPNRGRILKRQKDGIDQILNVRHKSGLRSVRAPLLPMWCLV